MDAKSPVKEATFRVTVLMRGLPHEATFRVTVLRNGEPWKAVKGGAWNDALKCWLGVGMVGVKSLEGPCGIKPTGDAAPGLL